MDMPTGQNIYEWVLHLTAAYRDSRPTRMSDLGEALERKRRSREHGNSAQECEEGPQQEVIG